MAIIDFPEDQVQRFVRELRRYTGLEMTPSQGRDVLHSMCFKHLAQHPTQRDLSLDELWPIVRARINDQNDPFPND